IIWPGSQKMHGTKTGLFTVHLKPNLASQPIILVDREEYQSCLKLRVACYPIGTPVWRTKNILR
ncbi:hypothetical protein, partial [Acinetobacter schindleri]|uniref:hypothetical protein n=1 Tax=Acinetobacter schindleri TaxID=108981 RepID=UPI002FDDC4E1